jgi:hypothetical protein
MEARTIGVERQPDANGSCACDPGGARALRVHVEMEVPMDFKMPLPCHIELDLWDYWQS